MIYCVDFRILARARRLLAGALALVLVFEFTSCGTLLYPNRRGQTGGRIDPGIAILDGVGLLFFIIPGLIAYAIDFTTGAIYLPRSAGVVPAGPDDFVVVQSRPGGPTTAELDAVLSERTGRRVHINDQPVQVVKSLSDPSELPAAYRKIAGAGASPG